MIPNCRARSALAGRRTGSGGAKYADALPLYRLEGILKRHGGRISRTTLANWIIRLDDVFQPLINLLREQQRSGDYLQADETRLQVLKERGKAPQSDKWMWLIRGGPPDRPVVLYEYDSSRSEEVPLRASAVPTRRTTDGGRRGGPHHAAQPGGAESLENLQSICKRFRRPKTALDGATAPHRGIPPG